MTESIIAAALSRIGKRVLHLDCNDYYGENWASFSLESIENWAESPHKNNLKDNLLDSCPKELINDNENFISLEYASNVLNIKKNEFVSEEILKYSEENNSNETQNCEELSNNLSNDSNLNSCELFEKMKKQNKRFNLDLCPKVSNMY